MRKLDKQKALEIMNLHADATKDEIAKRYGILTRKFRTIERDENGYTLEDITQAYNLLMGITFIDKDEEERQRKLRENPPLIAKILRVDPVKLENFFHYYRIHMLVAVVVIIAIVFTIRSCVNRVVPDFNLAFYGEVYVTDHDIYSTIEEDIKQKVPGIETPSVQFMSGNPSEAQYFYAMQMKLMAMVAAKELDILIMDGSMFESLAAQGMFIPLDEYVNMLGFNKEDYVEASENIETTEDGETIKGPLKLYGVDITKSNYVKEYNIIGNRIIAAVIVNSGKTDKALAYLRELN